MDGGERLQELHGGPGQRQRERGEPVALGAKKNQRQSTTQAANSAAGSAMMRMRTAIGMSSTVKYCQLFSDPAAVAANASTKVSQAFWRGAVSRIGMGANHVRYQTG